VTDDAELKAMYEISNSLSNLEQDAIRRVLKWIADRFQVEDIEVGEGKEGKSKREEGKEDFADFATVYDSASPESSLERALVAGYWFQIIQDQGDFDSQTINSELRHMGHPVSNITRTFDRLMHKKPRLAMQVWKSGKSKQARKRYKLTTEGIRHVQRMLAGKREQLEDE
jgi:hypothetical protein